MDPSTDNSRDRLAHICDEVAFWSLVVLAVGLPLAFYPRGNAYFDIPKMIVVRGAAMIGASAWMAKSITRARLDWVRTALDWPLLALFASGCVTTLLAVNRHVSFYGGLNTFDGLLNLVCYIVIFYLAVNFVATRKRLTWLSAAFLGTAAIVSTNASIERIAPALLPFPLAGGGVDPTRSAATFGNPVHTGAYLTIALPLTLAALLYWVRTSGHPSAPSSEKAVAALWSLAALLGLESAALLFTQTRAAWIGALIGVSAVVALLAVSGYVSSRGPSNETIEAHKGPARPWKYVAALVAVAATAALLYALSAQQSAAPRGQTAAQRAGEIAQVGSGTGFNRVYIWKMTVPIVLAQAPAKPVPSLDARVGSIDIPMTLVRPLFGYGFDFYLELFPKWRPFGWYRAIKEDAIPAQPHNDLLQVAVGQGLLGLAAYLAVLGALFVTTARGIMRARQRVARYALAGMLGAAVGYVIQIQASFAVVGVAALFWGVSGLAVSLAQGDERDHRRARIILPTASETTQWICLALIAGLVAWGSFGLYRAAAADSALRAAQDAFKRGTFGESLSMLDRAIALNPNESRFPMIAARMSGDSYARTADAAYADAGIALARRAEQLDPFLTEPYFTEASIYRDLATRAQQIGGLQRAAGLYRKILTVDRYNEDALFNLGLTLYDLGEYTDAAAQLRKAVGLRPADGDAYEALGAALIKAGNPGEALQALTRAAKLKPSSQYARQRLQELRDKMSGKTR